MVDYQKAKDILEYARQDQIKRFGTDELLLPFEPRLSNKKNLQEDGMPKLYALAINGRMFYFEGYVIPDKYDAIDKIANEIPYDKGNYDYSEYLQKFVDRVFNDLGITLELKEIQNVFRCRR